MAFASLIPKETFTMKADLSAGPALANLLSKVLSMWIVQLLIVAAALFIAGNIRFIPAKHLGKTQILRTKSRTLSKFFYASFLKPHSASAESGQQSALESFYESQADAYDASRRLLLRGREDMLGLAAAQLKVNLAKGKFRGRKPVWVDVGGGTGYNIEAMSQYLNVPDFFEKVILVDLSPSLLDVARRRFVRLGWNIEIVCQDARAFRLRDYLKEGRGNDKAELITMSYSLSMIPDYYEVVDSMSKLLSPEGILGIVDFYVQSVVDIRGRDCIGGSFNRHVNWLGRVFWRAWFDLDRVGLESGRRDYLEYKFGTLKTANERNYLLGGIPYYIFLGVRRESHGLIKDGYAIESDVPGLVDDLSSVVQLPESQTLQASGDTVINMSLSLPLPSLFYQNNHRRLSYNEHLPKHMRFRNEYIYTFTWEDPRVDHGYLKLKPDSSVLCITSAGDNVLDYILEANPECVHAIDVNPNQNHLLELKVAALQSLPYEQVWQMFGEGKTKDFSNILIEKLSPHLSSQACQYWLNHTQTFSPNHGLYQTGGSRHAIILVRWLFRALGLTSTVKKMCEAKTLEEQRSYWPPIRRILTSKPLYFALVGTEWFAWRAAGVPLNQLSMILSDHASAGGSPGDAIREYVIETLEPVVQNTLLSSDNYFYLLCLQGRYSERCRPRYLERRAWEDLGREGAFDGLKVHTDEICEVLGGIEEGGLTHAVIMDSMDWFDPQDKDASAASQIAALHRALRPGGKVLLRSAGLWPWYIPLFKKQGFDSKRVGAREQGRCLDRVNMYASTWLCTRLA